MLGKTRKAEEVSGINVLIMSGAESNYRLLIGKLDEFIRRYYQNLLIRGLIFTAAIVLSGYFLLSMLEYFSYLGVQVKTLLFFLFLGISIASFIWLIVVPLLAYFRLGKVIDHKTAAEIIGKHFSGVKDKLLNTLQLQEMAGRAEGSRELILASIDQKIIDLRPIPFTAAVNLRENRKFAKFALVPAAVIVVMVFAAPHILKDGTYRLVHYDRFFEKPAPFNFILLNDKLRATRNEDFTVRLKLEGEALPNEVFLEDENGFRYKLEKENNVSFEYAFRNLQKSRTFRFYAGGFYSKEYGLEVLANPALMSFDVNLTYPSYLGRKAETLKNTGELLVPEGTRIRWDFRSENTDLLLFILNGKPDTASRKEQGRFEYRLMAKEPANYALQPQSSQVKEADSVSFSIKVVRDLYPVISVQERADSLSDRRLYYIGEVKDDHGLTHLSFNYTRMIKGEEITSSIPIALKKGGTAEQFFYYLNTSDLNIKPGESVSYYFEVRDNDGVNGPKSARTARMMLNVPSREEQAAEVEESRSEVKSKLSEAAGKAARLQENTKKLNELLIQKQSLSFEEKNQVRDLIKQQKELEEFLEQIRKEKQEADLKRSELSPSENEALREKQEQIQELFDKVLDEETKKLIEELEKLLEQNNKNLTREQLQNLQLDNKTLEKELDRLLELYKQLEFDQLLQENTDRLQELAERQERLAEKAKEEAKDEKSAVQESLEQQQEINKDFGQIEEQLKKLEKKNQELENGGNFQSPEKEQQEIQEELDKSLEQLQKNEPEKAAEPQKKAAGQMQRLAAKMQEMRQQMAGMQQTINLQALRQILDNLLKVSFDQEALMKDMRSVNPNDPLFLDLARKQRNLKDDITLVRDSIYALSKRVPQLSSFVNKETEKINDHLGTALSKLSDRKVPEVLAEQQFVMTSVNNLAVMLSEVFEQLQQQMNNAGSGQGEKPSQGLAQLNKMQDELNRRLQQLKQGLKPGERVPREKSEELARLAREQQAIRNSLQKLNQELNKDGQGKLGNLDEVAREMEKTETELYNKRITGEMIQRQKEIMTRLLDAEKAERERDTEDKRESKQGKQFTPDFSKVLEEYNKQKEKQLELIQTLPPEVSSFYREKISEYFRQLKEGGE
ncbi:hypothetical protein EDD80_102110 [Anseongella ginsenosidimutans]|uniref:DUF4175 family protein n=1 Tax=Anseongella ginsenosidimutans TaxID=496056 RepID=A0A4R3KWR7_9SPHI|nr:DUF4175 family protein [Anseongella ginsenosidimutans]QEC51592.1 hypothetical protein FRZ59_03995 [Anseongella ginsenosidimutans]TCS88920.1 hypothetical protein EDD80_102110 [Anseongella ginsenosidimutans]